MSYPTKQDPAFWLMIDRYYRNFEDHIANFSGRYYSDDESYLLVATRYNECVRELAAEMLEQIIPLDSMPNMPKCLKEHAAWRKECQERNEASKDAYIAQLEQSLAAKGGE